MLAALGSGQLVLPVEAIAFTQIAEAHRRLDSKRARGKLVLDLSDNPRLPRRTDMLPVTVIGTGRHGTAIGLLFASHGVPVRLNHYRPAKATAARDAILRAVPGADVTVVDSVTEAVESSELVVLATLWNHPQRQVIDALGDSLQGQVLLDISNPLDVTPQGIIPANPVEGSAGGFVATLLPEGVGHARPSRTWRRRSSTRARTRLRPRCCPSSRTPQRPPRRCGAIWPRPAGAPGWSVASNARARWRSAASSRRPRQARPLSSG